MTDEQIKQLLQAAAALIQPHLRDNPHLRTIAHLTATWLMEQAQRAESASESSTNDATGATAAAQAASPSLAPSITTTADLSASTRIPSPPSAIPALPSPPSDAAYINPEDLNRLFTGPRVIAEPPAPASQIAPRQTPETIGLDALLELFARRFDLQRRGCALRLEMIEQPGDAVLLAKRKEILAEKEDCQPVLVWSMLPKFEPGPYCDLEAISRAYAACAMTTRLLKRTIAGGNAAHKHLHAVVQASATAGSALRSMLSVVNVGAREYGSYRDPDQDQLAKILIALGAEHAFYIERHLRLDDPATLADLEALEHSLPVLTDSVTKDLAKVDETSKKLKQLRYHVEQIAHDRSLNPDHDWTKIETVVAACINAGMPASDRNLGGLLQPLLSTQIPEHLKHTRHAISFEQQRASKSFDRQQIAEPAKTWSDDVLVVRERLQGKQIVMIGGEEDDNQKRRIESAFGCTLAWVALNEHGSSDPMIAAIQSADTRLVLVIIRLTGHLHAEKARQYASAAGKPLVLLPQGWNPEVIAHEVLQQASGMLSG